MHNKIMYLMLSVVLYLLCNHNVCHTPLETTPSIGVNASTVHVLRGHPLIN